MSRGDFKSWSCYEHGRKIFYGHDVEKLVSKTCGQIFEGKTLEKRDVVVVEAQINNVPPPRCGPPPGRRRSVNYKTKCHQCERGPRKTIESSTAPRPHRSTQQSYPEFRSNPFRLCVPAFLAIRVCRRCRSHLASVGDFYTI